MKPHHLLILLLSTWLGACASNTVVRFDQVPSDMAWPPPPEPPRIEYVGQFHGADELGLEKSFFSRLVEFFAGPENRDMTRPYAIDVNRDKVVVADPDAAAVHLFDVEQHKYRRLTAAGNARFVTPIGVLLENGRLFIADSGSNRVYILDQALQPVNAVEGLQRPTALAYDASRQQLYITDTLAHRVKVYDRDGGFLFAIGERGEGHAQFNFPSHLAFRDDRLFVNDTLNFRIQIFTHDGRHLSTFGKHGDATGSFGQPKGVAVDADGHVYVSDALASRVQIFDQNGVFLLDFGKLGPAPGDFQLPAGLTFWEDRIYVADSYNGRIQVFRYLKEEH